MTKRGVRLDAGLLRSSSVRHDDATTVNQHGNGWEEDRSASNEEENARGERVCTRWKCRIAGYLRGTATLDVLDQQDALAAKPTTGAENDEREHQGEDNAKRFAMQKDKNQNSAETKLTWGCAQQGALHAGEWWWVDQETIG